MPPPEELGLGPAEGQGMFTSILAGFVDALKARLAIEITSLIILVHDTRAGAFILSLDTISFLPREDKYTEKILTMGGIEAFLQSPQGPEDDDDDESVTSTSTVTSPSPSSARSPADHGLSESMLFSPQEAESLYMSAYSQPARSTYMSTLSYLVPPAEQDDEIEESGPEESEPPVGEPVIANKGFRFFYFEEDLVFHVTTTMSPPPEQSSQSISSPQTRETRQPPALQSAIPTAHLFLNPQVNLLPSISLISTILSLSPTSPAPSASSDVDTGGIDFSWVGGVVVHFGSDTSQTLARLADWKVTKPIGEETLQISIGKVEIVNSQGQRILSVTDSTKEGRLDVLLMPDLLHVSLPEVLLNVDLAGLATLQPLVKAMKHAWRDSIAPVHDDEFVHAEDPDDEDWNEDLIVEKPTATARGRQTQLEIRRVGVHLLTNDGTIEFRVDEINARITPSSKNTFEFSSATISLATSTGSAPILAVTKLGNAVPTVEVVVPEHSSQPGFLVNGAQEILDDFLVGEISRSDDAWGMIRADAANKSNLLTKIKLPRLQIQVSDAKEVDVVKKVLARVQRTIALFLEDSAAEDVVDDAIDLVVEFGVDEVQLDVKLDANAVFTGRCEGVEGTVVIGVAGGETVGVIDVSRIQVDIDSPDDPRKLLRESVHKVPSSPITNPERFHIVNRATIRSFKEWPGD
jgi:hypothetical protein